MRVNPVTVAILLTLACAGVGLFFHPGAGYPFESYFDPWLFAIVKFSLWQAFLSALFSCLFAIPFALIFAWQSFHFQWLIKGILNLFFIMPVLTVVLGIVAAFGDWFDVFGILGIVAAHLYLNVPYAIRIFWQRLSSVSENQKRLATTLNLSVSQRLKILYWPLLIESVRPVFVLVFLLCFSSFTIVLTMGGGPANTNLEVAIYQALKFDFDPRGAAIYASIHAAIAFLFMVLLGKRASFTLESIDAENDPTSRPSTLQLLALSLLLCVLMYPLLALLIRAIGSEFSGSGRLFEATSTSLLIGLSSATLAILFAVIRALSRTVSRWARFLDFGLLILPMMVITTGLFLVALRYGIAFKVTFVLIVWLNALMAMPLILNPIQQRIRRARQKYDRLVSVLHMNAWQRWRIVYWPAVAPVFPWAFALSLVLSLGDLGVAALVGSAQFVTLPILIYQAMGSYQMVLASQLTVLLLIMCSAVLLVSEWAGERKRADSIQS